jgi:hypothetical protein
MPALEDLLDRLDNTREQLLMALEYLPDEALLRPEAVGPWSIADLLNVLTAWDAEVVTGMMKLKIGKAPDGLLKALADPAAYNRRRVAENRERDLDGVFEDFQGARVKLEEWLDAFDQRALTDKNHFKSLDGRSLFDVVASATYKHEARYLPLLKAFAAEWEAAEEAAADEEAATFIPLAGLDVTPAGDGDTDERSHDNGHHDNGNHDNGRA